MMATVVAPEATLCGRTSDDAWPKICRQIAPPQIGAKVGRVDFHAGGPFRQVRPRCPLRPQRATHSAMGAKSGPR